MAAGMKTSAAASAGFGGGPLLLLYRRDLLAAAGLAAPPATWVQLLAAAAALEGKDGDGDGVRESGVCVQWHPGARRSRKGQCQGQGCVRVGGSHECPCVLGGRSREGLGTDAN